MEYPGNKGSLQVMKGLGLRSIKNSLIYTQLVNFKNEDEFIYKAAKTTEETKEPIEIGFGYVCDIADIKLSRKRKCLSIHAWKPGIRFELRRL